MVCGSGGASDDPGARRRGAGAGARSDVADCYAEFSRTLKDASFVAIKAIEQLFVFERMLIQHMVNERQVD